MFISKTVQLILLKTDDSPGKWFSKIQIYLNPLEGQCGLQHKFLLRASGTVSSITSLIKCDKSKVNYNFFPLIVFVLEHNLRSERQTRLFPWSCQWLDWMKPKPFKIPGYPRPFPVLLSTFWWQISNPAVAGKAVHEGTEGCGPVPSPQPGTEQTATLRALDLVRYRRQQWRPCFFL